MNNYQISFIVVSIIFIAMLSIGPSDRSHKVWCGLIALGLVLFGIFGLR